MTNYPPYDFSAAAGYNLLTTPESHSGQFAYTDESLHEVKGYGRNLVEDARAMSPFAQLTGKMESLSEDAESAPVFCSSDVLKEGGGYFRIAYKHIDKTAPYKLPENSIGHEKKDTFEHQDFSLMGYRKTRMTDVMERQYASQMDLLRSMEASNRSNFTYFEDIMNISCMLGVDFVDPDGAGLYTAALTRNGSAETKYALHQIYAGNKANASMLDSDGYLSSDEILNARAIAAAGETDDSTEIDYFRSPLVNGKKYDGVLIMHYYGADQLFRYDATFREAMQNAQPRGTDLYFSGQKTAFEWLGIWVIVLEKDLGRELQFTAAGYKSGRYYDATTGTTNSGTIVAPDFATAAVGYAPSVSGCTAVFCGGGAFAKFGGIMSTPILAERYDGVFNKVHMVNLEGRGVIKSTCLRSLEESQRFILIHHAGGSPNQVPS